MKFFEFLSEKPLHVAGGRVATAVNTDESSIVRLSAAAEKDNSDNDADDDEDSGPHPDPNHCPDRQHRVTTNWRRLKDVVNPVYPEVVSPENNL